MKFSQIALIIALSAVTTFAAVKFMAPQSSTATQQESAYERVIKTGVLRCGYASWDPMLIVDPKTRKITGIAAETIEAAASYLNLKVEWVAEYGWNDFIVGLQTGQADAFCGGPTPNSQRARVSLYTIPFLFSRFPFYSRVDDHRFDNNLAALNHPEVKIGVIDGTTASKIVATQFPEATALSLPETASFSQLFEDVAHKKTDAILQSAAIGALYIKNNPEKMHEVPGLETVRVLPNIFILNGGEYRLKAMLDAAVQELIATGTIETIVQKYDPGKQSYLLPAPPYTKSVP